MAASDPKPAYRWEAFRHWINLGLLAAGTLLGLVHDPMWWVATAGVEAATLWAVPDLPPFRQAVDKKARARQLLEERAYYLEQLFGLGRPSDDERSWLSRLLFEGPPVDLDSRIVERHSRECREYLEMREIVRKLDELRHVRGVRLQESDVSRLELVINGYLRLLIACEPLQQAVSGLDRRRLERDVADIEQQIPAADAAVRPALVERLRLARVQLDRHPRLEATLQLFRTRAEASLQQIRQIHGQVLADPGLDMTTVLDDMMDKQELLTDPLGQLAADQMVREVLSAAVPAGASGGAGVDRLRTQAATANRGAAPAEKAARQRTRG